MLILRYMDLTSLITLIITIGIGFFVITIVYKYGKKP
jgi:hypothetical protein